MLSENNVRAEALCLTPPLFCDAEIIAAFFASPTFIVLVFVGGYKCWSVIFVLVATESLVIIECDQ